MKSIDERQLRKETDAHLEEWAGDKKRPKTSAQLREFVPRVEATEARATVRRDETLENKKNARTEDRSRIPELDKRLAVIGECIEDLAAILERARPEILLRETAELHAGLEARVSEYRAQNAGARKELLETYPRLAKEIGVILTRCGELERERKDLRQALRAAGLDSDLPALTDQVDPERVETQLRAVWDGEEVLLANIWKDHSSAFAYFPRDERVTDAELFDQPGPRYSPTPSPELEGPREFLSGPGADRHRVWGRQS